MCGIIYYHTKKQKPVSKKIVKRYYQQKARGHEGFGVYRPLTNQLAHNPKEKDMLKHIRSLQDNVLLFHHRMPTSPRANVRNACHPFSTKDFFKRNYVLVHNGMISNKDYLKRKHAAMGIEYVSTQPLKYPNQLPSTAEFCDSEALMWEVALYLEHKIEKIEANGSIAFICYSHEDMTRPLLHFGRNTSNPLIINRSNHILSLSSTGEGKEVVADRLFTYDYATDRITDESLPLGYDYQNNYGYNSHAPHPVSQTLKPTESTDNQTKINLDHLLDDGNETVRAVRSSKDPKDLTTKIKKLYKFYLHLHNGEFAGALDTLLEDMDTAEDRGEIETVDILEAVGNLLSSDPFYLNDNSIHPDYLDDTPTLKKIGFRI